MAHIGKVLKNFILLLSVAFYLTDGVLHQIEVRTKTALRSFSYSLAILLELSKNNARH
jgi:hypothetical protein